MPHQERRAFLGSQQGQRSCVANNRDGKGTFQLFHGRLHSGSQFKPLNQMFVGEVSNHFSVGVGLKHVAFSGERFSDFLVIFNDAVVHHAH